MRFSDLLLAIAASFIAMTGAAAALDASRPGALLPLKVSVAAPGGAKALCATYDWACAGGNGGAAVGPEEMALVSAVNRKANAAIRPVTDLEQYHVAEKWALPTAQGGDCEDYALYKKARLIEAGISPDRLLLASVLDKRGQSHAVLVVRAEGADLVLDNLTDRIRRWDQTGYTFLRMQDPRDPQAWVALLVGGKLAVAGS